MLPFVPLLGLTAAEALGWVEVAGAVVALVATTKKMLSDDDNE